MSVFAKLMYRALVWKERARAQAARGLPPWKTEGGKDSHLETGRRGETLAYWHLRHAGYTMVGRNHRLKPHSGELDLIGWDGPTLAFIEVKTRTSDEAGPPGDAVGREQRKRIIRAAAEYLRRLRNRTPNYRFDIASVSWDRRNGFQVGLIKDAFKD